MCFIFVQYSGPSKDALAYVEWLKEDDRFSDILVQVSPAINGHAFPKLKLRYKPSLVQASHIILFLVPICISVQFSNLCLMWFVVLKLISFNRHIHSLTLSYVNVYVFASAWICAYALSFHLIMCVHVSL